MQTISHKVRTLVRPLLAKSGVGKLGFLLCGCFTYWGHAQGTDLLATYRMAMVSSQVRQAVSQHRAAKERVEQVARQTEHDARDAAYLGVLVTRQNEDQVGIMSPTVTSVLERRTGVRRAAPRGVYVVVVLALRSCAARMRPGSL